MHSSSFSSSFSFSSSSSVFTKRVLFCSTTRSITCTSSIIPQSHVQGTKQPDEQYDKDVIFMQLALRHAQHAYREHEVPVGAVIVNEKDIVLAGARNMIEQLKDATAHAEIECIRKASKVINNWRLSNCTLYTTLEPCAMCLNALRAARVSRIVFGARDHTKTARHHYIDQYKDQSSIGTSTISRCREQSDVNSELMTRVTTENTGGDTSATDWKMAVTGGVLADDSSLLLKRFFKQLRTSSAAKKKETSI